MPDQPDSEEHALVQRALYDPDAFQTLYEHYVRRVYAYVAARISDPHDAEDVVAEVFLRVVRSLDQLHNPHHTSFAAWLFAIARHAVVDHYRRHEQAGAQVALEQAAPLVAAPETEPEPMLYAREDAARLRALIAALPERQREIVMLRYYGGLRNQEIAAVLQIGEKTVSGYLSRALRDLHTRYLHPNPASQPDTEARRPSP